MAMIKINPQKVIDACLKLKKNNRKLFDEFGYELNVLINIATYQLGVDDRFFYIDSEEFDLISEYLI